MVFFTWEVLGLSCVQSRHYPCSGLVMVWVAKTASVIISLNRKKALGSHTYMVCHGREPSRKAIPVVLPLVKCARHLKL